MRNIFFISMFLGVVAVVQRFAFWQFRAEANLNAPFIGGSEPKDYFRIMRLVALLVVFSVVLGVSVAKSSAAQSPHFRAREVVQARNLRPMSEIFSVVRSRYGGRVLDISLVRGRRPVYRVKLLTRRGNVMIVGVDARTARIISERGGDRRRRGRR